jgi:PAS domain-containing protein
MTQNGETISIVVGLVSTVAIFFKKIKKFIIKKYEQRKIYNKSKHEIPEILQKIKSGIDNLDTRLKNVEYEISPNGGGSMKDSLKIIKAEIEAMFWLNPKPSFRTTSKGMNVQVNEAYCHLCATTSEELLRLNWKNFIDDEVQLDDYMRRWEESTEAFSQFAGKLKFKNYRGEYMGEWLVKVRPLGSIDEGRDYLWHGTIYPLDQKAREYARNFNIPLN